MRGPFGAAALDYFDAGWPDPIPCWGNKAPRIKGFSGGFDYWPDRAQIEQWATRFPRSNIGLRLPHGFLGLDFDMYEGRAARETMDKYTQLFGSLPLTWISTSRKDGSGIRVYRLPDGFDGQEFADPGPGVEAIKWSHRYVLVAPSRHPRKGKPPYVWWAPVGGRMRRQVDCAPSLDEVSTVLPLAWAEGLPKSTALPREPGESASLSAWLSGQRDVKAKPCPVTQQTLAGYVTRIQAAGSNGGAHPAMNMAIHALCGDAESGHAGLYRALVVVRDAYVKAVADRRSERVARSDLRRSLEGDLSKRELVELSDPCAEFVSEPYGFADECQGKSRSECPRSFPVRYGAARGYPGRSPSNEGDIRV